MTSITNIVTIDLVPQIFEVAKILQKIFYPRNFLNGCGLCIAANTVCKILKFFRFFLAKIFLPQNFRLSPSLTITVQPTSNTGLTGMTNFFFTGIARSDLKFIFMERLFTRLQSTGSHFFFRNTSKKSFERKILHHQKECVHVTMKYSTCRDH